MGGGGAPVRLKYKSDTSRRRRSRRGVVHKIGKSDRKLATIENLGSRIDLQTHAPVGSALDEPVTLTFVTV